MLAVKTSCGMESTLPSVVRERILQMLREAGEEPAIQGVAAMQRGRIIDLTVQRALDAAALSLRHSLPMADSIILAAAREHGATVWTLDKHFKGFPDVRYFAKK